MAHKLTTSTRSALALATLIAGATQAMAAGEEIVIGEGVHPENIASTANGDLLISSIMQGIIYRVPAGSDTAEVWIEGIGPTMTGVFSEGENVYLCVNGPFGSNIAAMQVYDLATATEKASYDLPEGGLCSDIAVSDTGEVYVTQLGQAPGRIMKVEGDALVDVIVDDGLAGVDGLAFLNGELIVNNLRSGELYRINLDQNPVTYTTLTLSQPLAGPDGMRTTEDGTALLIAEAQSDRISLATIDGDTATIEVIGTGYEGLPTGVAQIGNTVYVVEGYFQAMSPDSGVVAPETFVVKSFPLAE